MKRNLALTVFVAILVSVLVHLSWPSKIAGMQTEMPKKETALERIKRTGTIRCGYLLWPLFFDLDPNTKELSGLYKDFTDTVISLAGWKIEYIQLVAGNEVTDLKIGRVDAMCGYGPWYLSSIKEVDYSRPLAYASVYLYGREEETRFKHPDDINNAGISLVGIDGDVSIDLAQRLYPKAKLYPLPGTTDGAQLLLNVATRKADAVITDPLTVAGFNKTNMDKVKSLFPGYPVATYGMEFGVNKGEAELLETLNGYSDMALNMNLIDPILQKYDPSNEVFFSVTRPYQKR
ncbi:MAG: amino acid transporter substrate-binding protein family [Alphaproteobacteria bacterium]|nr:amino acid transporter substrate-binding protein family [Alphaproteobacteria bacterium]